MKAFTDLKPIPTLLSPKDLNSWKPIAKREEQQISAIILHSTDKKPSTEYLKLSLENGFFIHFLIDKKGEVYWDPSAFQNVYAASPGMDVVSLHIAYEGSQEQLLQNSIQSKRMETLVKELTESFAIPKSNYDIISQKGVFTHNQAKRRFGGFVDFSPCGGEKALERLLINIGGEYKEEDQWYQRYESGWVLKKENKQRLQETFFPTNGRGISKPEKVSLPSIESDVNGYPTEAYRVKYTFRGKIKPTCIVLHYTAISDYFQSLKTLENRNLTATLMVDKNGKAYQLVDSLEDRAAAATGTNDQCIQIEIIAKDTAELISQPEQTEKVKVLVLELAQKYKIPLNNEDIQSLSGIFSHTQAKKRWGGSIFLNAKDFDPGEEYMELILNSIGGKYFPESEWKNRSSLDWAILYKSFQP
ncbi:lipoprotein [Leptospira ryugenii]|uniref:N-acetylmuramoyl-L-alanine amidase n=1 Tax=Leptospira ryugenii TaxID=1917863 RepID=A0A2P2E3C0_9LEPT|nr:N-acetylmuramoyl-L-alanine amidase [Leptospira ryugenii]GBF51392.1 lipoprotein [Leptospira ryugenii]